MTCEKHGGGTGSIFCKFCDAEQVDAHEAKLAAKPDVAGLVERLQKQSVCIHIAAEPECAKDVSDGLRKAADALLSLSAQLAEKEAECEGLRERLQDFIAEHDNACIEQKGNTLTLLWSRNNDMVARAKAAIAARDCAVYKPLPKEVRDGILTLLTK